MISKRTISIAIATAAVAFSAAAMPATAGVAPLNVLGAKAVDGPYKQITRAQIRRGGTKSYFIRVDNSRDVTQEMILTSGSEGRGFRIAWFKGKRPNPRSRITRRLNGAGYTFDLLSGQSRYFNARVRRSQAPNRVSCFGGEAYSTTFDSADGALFAINGNCGF